MERGELVQDPGGLGGVGTEKSACMCLNCVWDAGNTSVIISYPGDSNPAYSLFHVLIDGSQRGPHSAIVRSQRGSLVVVLDGVVGHIQQLVGLAETVPGAVVLWVDIYARNPPSANHLQRRACRSVA